MSNNQGKGGGQPADDRTLLDPLDADELRALREARQRLQGGGASPAPASSALPSAAGADAGDDEGDAPTRAMMAIPSFDSPPSSKFMPDPKPMLSGAVSGNPEAATVLDGKVPAGTATQGQGTSPPPGSQAGNAAATGNAGAKPPDGFGENTLMWMQPVKAPEPEVIPERGAAAAAGMLPTQLPAETRGRKILAGIVVALAGVVVVMLGVVFLKPAGEPSVVELITNPPKATVLIDGKKTSVLTPMKASLPPGPHQIEIRLEGYRPETIDLNVLEGADPTRRNIELYPISKPGMMTVSVTVEPVASNITLDGKLYPARKIVRVANVDPKKPHKLEIEAGGYQKVVREISAGQLQAEYSYKLERTPSE